MVSVSPTKPLVAIILITFICFCIVNIMETEAYHSNQPPFASNRLSLTFGKNCTPINFSPDYGFRKAARPGTRTLQVEVFPPVHTLTELLRPDWKSYCFGSCIFQIGNCQPESDVLGVNNKRKIYFQGTFTFVVDFHLNPVECSLPPEAIKYGKTPEIMIFEVGSEKVVATCGVVVVPSSPTETEEHPLKTPFKIIASVLLVCCSMGAIAFLIMRRRNASVQPARPVRPR